MISRTNTRLVSEVGTDFYFECRWPDSSANLDCLLDVDEYMGALVQLDAQSLRMACSQDEYFTAFSDIQSGELFYLVLENGNRLALEQGGCILI